MERPKFTMTEDTSTVASPEVYKTFDDGYIVRAMTPQDAKIAQNFWSSFEILSSADIDVTLEMCSPGRGCYVVEYKGNVVACATRVHWGRGIYYGSWYFVDEKHRSRGFGTRLRDQVVFSHVGDNILAIDALLGDVSKKNQEKFRYVPSFKSHRLIATAKSDYGIKCSCKLVKVQGIPFQDIIDFDSEHFVVKDSPQRRFFLDRWLHLPGGSTCVALSDSGSIVGYGARRPAMEAQPKNHCIGPLYAESADLAKAILQQLCQEVEGEDVSVNVWTRNAASVRMLEEFGFTLVFECVRMHIDDKQPEYKDTVYLFTGMDTCGF